MVSKRMRRALEYYSMGDISPKDRRKIDHPSNNGWSSKTIDEALDAGFLTCGEQGWHVLTDKGREALLSKAGGE